MEPRSDEFSYLDTTLAGWILVFLLAGNLARMAASTEVVIYEQSIFGHSYTSPSRIFVSLTSVHLY
jgi:hypothetical protein